MTEAQEFLQPFIESNNYWFPILIKAGLIISVVSIAFIIFARVSDRKGSYNAELFFYLGALILGLVSFFIIIACLCGKCENVDMEKFPQAHYNKIKRTVQIEKSKEG